jgi:hypothetical protein
MKLPQRIGPVIPLIGVLGVLLPGAALGARRTAVVKHHVSLRGEIETLSSTGPIGVAGTKDTDAGILDGRVSGGPRWSGALRQVVTWGPALKISSTGTAFDAEGSLRFTLLGKFAPRPAGGIALTGTMTVTGGTGRYAHARGSLRVTGIASVAVGSTRSTFDLAGVLRSP